VNKMMLLAGVAVAYFVLKGKAGTLAAAKKPGTPTEGVTAQLITAGGDAAAGAVGNLMGAIGIQAD
jgi:hypothetical protein